MLVVQVNHRLDSAATPNTVLGPFHIDGSLPVAFGADSDVVFGTKQELIVAFEPRDPGPTPDGGTSADPWLSAAYDFVLQPRG